MSRLSLSYQIGQRQVGVWACHEVCIVIVQQVFLYSLSHAA